MDGQLRDARLTPPRGSGGEPRGISPSWAAIYRVVRAVPRGRVATYGQVARLADLEGHARLVGYALHALPDGAPLPWHRVVNAKGAVSRRRSGSGHDVLQRRMLEREGVRFDREGRLSLAVFRWKPREESVRARNPRAIISRRFGA